MVDNKNVTFYLLTLTLVEELQFTHTLEQNAAPDSNQRQRKLHCLLLTQVNLCLNKYSLFASVGAAEKLKRIVLRFMGVGKTTTKRFPVKHVC